jgi:hypothetical protein
MLPGHGCRPGARERSLLHLVLNRMQQRARQILDAPGIVNGIAIAIEIEPYVRLTPVQDDPR